MKNDLTWKEFERVDIRVGTVVSAEVFAEAIKPAYRLQIDFGELGVRKTSAQITKLYEPEQLVGRQVLAVVNFPPKQIANLMSECLVLGAVGTDGEVTLIRPDSTVMNGLKIG
ncbi:tRNA-binding protein [Reichenbachiella agarivorans]|uniref:tRNA-binding protein n=1 Tax=Reichenbachiella agarivorans TaxID=2979464 RepID=A0ABY6CNA5_9BACT|nr:tRNA-binding protein [Reichenbachiella agarivorans]UXP30953.1 tRNA-binding protein [Reichenbachiella agarivorans]